MKLKDVIQAANLHAATAHAQAKADAVEGNAAHTPGPFSISGMAADNHIMASWRGGKANVAIVIAHPHMKPSELEANKALLAAAPELLEALKPMICGTRWITDEQVEAARAAIAKAKGTK